MFLLIMMLMNMLFLNFNNPLIMGIILMLQTLNTILLMGKIYYNFWFSYIILLVFIGGLFILFVYVISLIYNNKFFYYKINNLIYLLFLYIMFMMIIKKKNFFIENYEMKFKNKMLFKENFINMIKFYNFPNYFINLLVIMYLLLLMIIVVKITNFYMGPIKMKF